MGSEPSVDQLKTYSSRFASIRLILILLVVYVHFPLEMSPADAGVLLPALIAKGTFLRFSVLVLTVISGFIMFTKRQDQGGWTTINKKISTLLVPFLVFNLSLVALLYLGQQFHLIKGQRLDLSNGDWRVWCDAVFACTTRPVNYPLYFLKDLFVVSVICIVASPMIRRYPVFCIIAAALVVQFDADGYLILRTRMLLAFLIGAAMAIYNFPLKFFEQDLVVTTIVLVALCWLHFYTDANTTFFFLPIVGGIWVWSFAKWLTQFRIFETIVELSKYSFPIYLLHGAILFALLAIGLNVHPTFSGLAIWALAPLVVTALAVVVFEVMKRIAPKPTAWATGGRGA